MRGRHKFSPPPKDAVGGAKCGISCDAAVRFGILVSGNHVNRSEHAMPDSADQTDRKATAVRENFPDTWLFEIAQNANEDDRPDDPADTHDLEWPGAKPDEG